MTFAAPTFRSSAPDDCAGSSSSDPSSRPVRAYDSASRNRCQADKSVGSARMAPATAANDAIPPTRREFLAAACAVPLLRAARAGGIRLGGPIFLKSDDPAELAREHRRWGYSAAYCPAATVNDRERINDIKKAYAAEQVVIAEVGAWRNMLDPDAQKRA